MAFIVIVCLVDMVANQVTCSPSTRARLYFVRSSSVCRIHISMSAPYFCPPPPISCHGAIFFFCMQIICTCGKDLIKFAYLLAGEVHWGARWFPMQIIASGCRVALKDCWWRADFIGKDKFRPWVQYLKRSLPLAILLKMMVGFSSGQLKDGVEVFHDQLLKRMLVGSGVLISWSVGNEDGQSILANARAYIIIHSDEH